MTYCSEDEQGAREALIQAMAREGVIRGTEFANGLPTVLVPESFLRETLEAQAQTLAPIFTYWECETGGQFGHPGDFMRIRVPDGSPLGRRVGIYSPDKGVRDG